MPDQRNQGSSAPDGALTVAMALATLGLEFPVSESDVGDARRRLAKSAHPDVGGTDDQMRRINQAAEVVLLACGRSGGILYAAADPASSATEGNAQVRFEMDHPSFIVEALPVEAFEALLIVASCLGEVIDDEPPYRLDVALNEPPNSWCQLVLVPDAGASTVSLVVGSAPGWSSPNGEPNAEYVRDLWVLGLNQLDWGDLRQL